MLTKLGQLLCMLGLHALEKEPSHKELIKETCIHIFLASEGIQQGVKKCLRLGCDYSMPVWRTGWVGMGSHSSGWMRLSKKQKEYIDSLPVM